MRIRCAKCRRRGVNCGRGASPGCGIDIGGAGHPLQEQATGAPFRGAQPQTALDLLRFCEVMLEQTGDRGPLERDDPLI